MQYTVQLDLRKKILTILSFPVSLMLHATWKQIL